MMDVLLHVIMDISYRNIERSIYFYSGKQLFSSDFAVYTYFCFYNSSISCTFTFVTIGRLVFFLRSYLNYFESLVLCIK